MIKALCISIVLFYSSIALAAELELYGSARLQIESVAPDNQQNSFDSYNDLRDAYSRIGINLTHQLTKDWTLLIKHEIPIDLANQKIQLAYDNDTKTRVSKVEVNTPLGKVWYGRDWLPFYNSISYSVDRFSGYYSGWATYTSFREKETFYYQSPQLGYFKFTYSSTDDNGRDAFGSENSNRNQYVVSSSFGQWGINLAVDDLNSETDQRIFGAAISYTADNWYLGAKVEIFDSNDVVGNSDSYGADGTQAINLYTQYSINEKNIIKAMLAKVDGSYGDDIFHLGYDYLYSEKMRFFVEYYSEQTTAAISERRRSTLLGSGDFNQPADSGGNALTIGMRYDFSWKN